MRFRKYIEPRVAGVPFKRFRDEPCENDLRMTERRRFFFGSLSDGLA
jgi:hypothetical protein